MIDTYKLVKDFLQHNKLRGVLILSNENDDISVMKVDTNENDAIMMLNMGIHDVMKAIIDHQNLCRIEHRENNC